MDDEQKETAPAPIAPLPPLPPLTPERRAEILAAAGRHKDNHDYMESGRQQVAEYRRQIQEEWERDHASEDTK